jgi:hypothetical protein
MSVFLLHCSVVGFAVNTHLKLWEVIRPGKRNYTYLEWFFALGSGLMTNITALFLAGISGFFNMYMIVSVGVMLMIFSCLVISHREWLHNKTPLFCFKQIGMIMSFQMFDLLSMFAIFIILMMIAVFRGWGFDDAMYHLPLARTYVENQGIVLNEYLRFPLFPQNMEVLFALGLMIGGVMIAQGMAIIPIFITILGLIGSGVWLLGSTVPGFLLVLLLFYLPVIRDNLGHAEVDIGLALFSWGATLALALWASSGSRSRGALILAGMLAGGAAGTKIFGGVLALLLGLYLLLVRRDWGASLTYAIVTIAFGSWWYIRSVIISGDPIHPVGGNIFGYFLWNSADLVAAADTVSAPRWLSQNQEQGTQGVQNNLLYLWSALQKAGVSVWILAFLSGIYAKKESRGFRIFYGIFLIYLLFWFFTTQVNRYLAPVFAVASFLSAYFLYRAALGRLLGTLISRRAWLGHPNLPAALSLVVLLPAAAYLYMKYDIAQRGERLQKREGYTLFQEANKLIPIFGPKLVQVGFEGDIYFFDGTVIGDWFGRGRYSSMMTCSTTSCQMLPPSKLAELMKGFNSRMLAVNTNVVTIDITAHEEFFDLREQTGDGVLLTLR